ncbi:hypothetical protein KY285_024228 [Solanum tuberosum]|nr:hypothetical protein KY289_024563 [Solanum tuberosum]KAH0673214.1 hypothetical protein KY284_024301 [Solanum tuberosum]KAH0676427.1 hypothetical protein KY285_024228 [Solanum tuberosum]
MSIDTMMEEYEYSFDSNTDAIVYGVSDPSTSDECMISDPNIPSSSSSSEDDDNHQQQQQISIAAAASSDGTNDLTESSCASSSRFTDENQIAEQRAVMTFNVDFGELSGVALGKSCNIEIGHPGFHYGGNEPIEEVVSHIYWSSVWDLQVEDDLYYIINWLVGNIEKPHFV